jgi:hypothetical protein
MSRRNRFSLFIAALTALPLASTAPLQATTLVGNPFINGFQNWIDPVQDRLGDWRVNLQPNTVNTIMETSDLIPATPPGNSPAPLTNTSGANGAYVPALLIQDSYTTPTTYDLNARMWSSDDDGWGLVFGYQDPNNYYRVFFRAQANGNLGGTTGTSVQKIAGGVVTQLNPAGAGVGNTAFPTLPMIATRQPFDVKVEVNGINYAVYVAGVNGGNPLQMGSDAGLAAGKVGIQSWAQQIGPNAENPYYGTELESLTVTDNTGTLYSSGSFANPTSTSWRTLIMTNSTGLSTNDIADALITGDETGNFGLGVNGPWIHQRSNGFVYATGPTGSNGPDQNPFDHIDFMGPAIVVDNPGSTSYTDYEMKVRIGARDDDGLGVLVRVQDDDNFYRINFSRQTINDATNSRAPRGLSIQKVQNGVWSEIFRDDQDNPLFVYLNGAGTPNTPMPKFDLRVQMIGNTFGIQVVDDVGTVINYPLISDNSLTPILSGSVGLTTWGTENVYWSAYGGDANSPFLVEIPEPATVCLALIAAVCGSTLNRRRPNAHN